MVRCGSSPRRIDDGRGAGAGPDCVNHTARAATWAQAPHRGNRKRFACRDHIPRAAAAKVRTTSADASVMAQ